MKTHLKKKIEIKFEFLFQKDSIAVILDHQNPFSAIKNTRVGEFLEFKTAIIVLEIIWMVTIFGHFGVKIFSKLYEKTFMSS